MKTATISVSESIGRFKFLAVFCATYPLFLMATMLRRRFAHETDDVGPRARGLSAFAEAQEGAEIAISYALEARTILQRFDRAHPAKRLS